MKCKLLNIIIIIFLTRSAASQCPERAFVYNQFNTISEGASEKEVITGLKRLAVLCRQCNMANDSTYAKILHVLGRTLWYQNQLDSAIIVTKEAIRVNSLNTAEVSAANLCHSYFNLGCIFNDLGDLKRALAYLDRTIAAARRFPGKMGSIAGAYNKKANIYTSQGDYEKAIASSELGYSYGEKIGKKDLMARSLMEGAQALIELNYLKRGENALVKSLGLLSGDSNDALKGSIYSLIAYSKMRDNKPGEVIRYYNKSFLAYKNDGFDYGCGQAANNLGDYYFQYLSNFSEALKCYQLALQFMPENLGKALIWGNIASIYKSQKAFDLALIYIQKGLLLAPIDFKDKNVLKNPPSSAIQLAVDKSGVLDLVQKKADTWLSYGKDSQNSKEKLQNALKTYMLADTMIDFMRWEHTGKVTKLFWRDKTRAMYEHAIETCNLLNDPVTAFYFFEKSRAVMLNDQLNELGANQQLIQKDAERERSLRQRISDLQNRLGESKPESKQYISLRSDLFHVQEEQQIFLKQLEKANPQYYAYKYDNGIPTISEIRSKVIAEGQTFISYFVGDSAVYGLSITAKEISLKKMNIDEYKRHTHEFQRLLSSRQNQNKEFGNYLNAANRLYELLLKPFRIKSERIVISPDGNFLPFESLSFSPSKPEFLVQKYAFSYTYSAGFLTKTTRQKSALPSTNTFLGIAPVTFSPKLKQASLPGSEISLKAISEHFYFPKMLTEANASRKAFLEELSDYKIIQLLTHASADSSDIEPTLYFADSTLRLSELPSSVLSKTQLMILSACRTGVGKNQKGEGVFSLARGFAGIGIPSTLTTLWSVENKAIYELTELFYKQLDKGLPLDLALQKAQIEWLNTASKSDQLPYSWAGMVLVGNTEPVETGIGQVGIYIFSLAIVVLIPVLLRKRRQRSVSSKVTGSFTN